MSRASEAAQQLLSAIGREDMVGQDLTHLVLGLGLYYDEEPMNGCDGRIVFSKSGKKVKITINSETHYLPRKRFSVGHELGHYLLGHNRSHVDGPGTIDCYGKKGPEAEANEFASELLMPTPAFMKYVADRPFSPQLIKDVANYFGTSISSVVYRYMMCGPHPIVVAYSLKGTVKWICKSRNMWRWNLDLKGKPVPENSITYEYFQNGNQYEEIRDVDMDVWFDTSRYRVIGDAPRLTCHEYCFISEKHGGVTAVIWED